MILASFLIVTFILSELLILSALKISSEREIELAKEIQQGLLPKDIPQIQGIEISSAWQPSEVVSGDYFDILKFSDSKVGLCIADVAGKGIPAALLMSNLQAGVRTLGATSLPPRELCEKLNQLICSNAPLDKFITLFYCLLDVTGKRLIYTNAGHNLPILVRQDGSLIRSEKGGRGLGLSQDSNYQQGEVELMSGDRVLLFTDGVIEATNSKKEEFGEARLIELLVENRGLGAAALQKRVMKAVTKFNHGNAEDDMTLIAISVK